MTKYLKLILVIAVGLMTHTVIQAVSPKSNEKSAVSALRLINIEEQLYNSTYPSHGFACSLEALGGDSKTGPPTPEAAHLIEPDLASGHKFGYTFAISKCVTFKIKGQDMVFSYKLTATPDAAGHTGIRGFCTDQDGEIKFDPKGGTNCTEVLH